MIRNQVNSIEVVDEYKYLGMWFSKSNKKHLDIFEKKGRKSSYSILDCKNAKVIWRNKWTNAQ